MSGELRTDDRTVIEALRAALERVGYTEERVREALTSEGELSRDTAELPYYVRVLPPGEPISAAVRLFMLGLPVPREEAAAALAPPSLDGLEAIGVLRPAGDEVEAAVEIVPTAGIYLASDRSREHWLPERADHVPGPSPPAAALSSLTVRRPVASALDVGTGSGIHALLAATHAQRVVGVDVNARALRFAEFNAFLNGISNIELREGSLFDPVEGEAFDLVVSNPPYLISPESDYLFRDAGRPGHAFIAELIERLPAHLNEGGFASVVCEWGHRADEDWSTPVRGWLEGSGCDAIVLQFVVRDPLHHAAEWNERRRGDPRALAEALDRWTAYCASLGIEAISWGVVVLRRRTGENWLWTHAAGAGEMVPAREHLLRLFANQDALARLDERALLETRFSLAPDHVLQQTIFLHGGEGIVERGLLRLRGGLAFQVELDGISTELLANVDGRRTLREAVGKVAAAVGAPVDGDSFAAGALPGIRRLLELGFLVPAEGGDGED